MTYYNFVKETCTGTGSTITLLGAVPGFLSFGDVSFEGDKFAYVIVDADGQRKVTGIAADFFYPDTMMRADTWAFDGTSVVADPSVNITLSAGVHTIYCAESAEQLETILSRIGLVESDLLKRRKNAVINGNFDIWQRGTSQTSGGYGSADRWFFNKPGASTLTASRQAFDLGTSQPYWSPKYFLRMEVAAGAGASDAINVQQRIEGVGTFAGRQVTLSFWAKADASRSISCELVQYFGNGGSPSPSVQEIGVTKVNVNSFSWTRFEITVTLPSVFGKTLGTNNNDSLICNFWVDAGSDFDSRTDSLGHQSGTFEISQVQLELGGQASDFEVRTPGEELELCRRYLRIVYFSWGGWITTVTQIRGLPAGENLAHVMRAPPTITGDFTERLNVNTPLLEVSASRWMANPTAGNANTVLRWQGVADAEI